MRQLQAGTLTGLNPPSLSYGDNRINSSGLPIRKISISCNAILSVEDDRQIKINFNEKSERKKKNSQKIVIDIKDKFGLNSVFKAIDLKEEATGLERNRQIGGHKSGH